LDQLFDSLILLFRRFRNVGVGLGRLQRRVDDRAAVRLTQEFDKQDGWVHLQQILAAGADWIGLALPHAKVLDAVLQVRRVVDQLTCHPCDRYVGATNALLPQLARVSWLRRSLE